jgi:antitoxin component of RelBE/YafQ-DinJ toxin-antitoxin module
MARRKQQVEEEVVEEVEDELEELEEDTDEDEDTGEDDDLEELEEVEEEEPEEQPKSRKAKAAAKKAAAPKKSTQDGHNSQWLAEHVSQVTGKDVDSRQLRMILRKLAKEGALAREVGEDRTRYSFTGPNDPTVKAVIKAVKEGATERKSNVDNLKKAREAKAAKKAAAEAPAKSAPAKSAPAKKPATKKAAPAKATKVVRRRRSAE